MRVRRRYLFLLPALLWSAAPKSMRGRLIEGRKLSVGGQVVSLEGEEAVLKVLDDERLWGSDFEVVGVESGPGRVVIDGIHTKPLWVYVKGERLGVSYWCEICYIRTYSPGKCWCCQEETKLDPKDPNTPDRKP
jgi:hypothetical protein